MLISGGKGEEVMVNGIEGMSTEEEDDGEVEIDERLSGGSNFNDSTDIGSDAADKPSGRGKLMF